MNLELARQRIAERTRPEGECLVWTGNIGTHGYPRLNMDGELFLVHRLVRSLADGHPYDGLVVHHECRNKMCVRLEHLRVLTSQEHAKEHHGGKAFCPRGHSLADAYVRRDTNRRACRECIRRRAREQQTRRSAALPRPTPRICARCGLSFTPKKNNGARFCGDRCRLADWMEHHP